MANKRELQEENETLRQKLEEAYDVIGDALGFDEDETDSAEEDGESDASDLDDEE